MNKTILLILTALFFISTPLFASPRSESPSAAAQRQSITIAAAASLRNVYENELIPLFQRMNPNITVSGVYDASGRLQNQIVAGLPVDIFMSASPLEMDFLAERNLIDRSSVQVFLRNRVVLIKSTGIPTQVTGFENVLSANMIAVGNPESVPAGRYAREVFTSLGIWEDVLAKASLATNVTEVLFWVAEGNAEVGVVYKSDAVSDNRVEIIDTAVEEISASYPVGITSNSQHRAAAQAFINFLSSEESLAIFRRHGFD